MTTRAALTRATALVVALASITSLALAVVAATPATQPTALLTLATAAALSIAVAAIAVHVAAPPPSRALRIGHRAHSHRESLDRVAAPAHPDTAGRPRPRAPGRPLQAA